MFITAYVGPSKQRVELCAAEDADLSGVNAMLAPTTTTKGSGMNVSKYTTIVANSDHDHVANVAHDACDSITIVLATSAWGVCSNYSSRSTEVSVSFYSLNENEARETGRRIQRALSHLGPTDEGRTETVQKDLTRVGRV